MTISNKHISQPSPARKFPQFLRKLSRPDFNDVAPLVTGAVLFIAAEVVLALVAGTTISTQDS
jgi:hypothetical protein